MWRMQWGDKSRCGKGHCEAPAGMQGGLTVEQAVAGRCQEAGVLHMLLMEPGGFPDNLDGDGGVQNKKARLLR